MIVKEKTTTSFADRYPQLVFLMTCTEFAPFTITKNPDGRPNAYRGDFYLHDSNSLEKELNEIEKKGALEQIETLYLYGLGLGHYYFPLKKWLHQNPYRDLIFIEEDLGAIDACMRSRLADEIFADPKVHIRFLWDQKRRSAFFRECAMDFPTERIEMLALKSYRKKWPSKIRNSKLSLLRKTTLESALFFEDFFYHKLMRNLVQNFQRWPESFWANGLKGKCQDIPAIVCGAGPSLGQSAGMLKQLHDRALIIGGGSTISSLTKLGIQPHIGMAIDPNPEEYNCLKPAHAFETPFIYGSRLLPESFHLMHGPYGFLSTKTGGLAEHWLEEKCDLKSDYLSNNVSDEALSITTSCISYAAFLGCNPIILLGVDLAFTGEKQYAGDLSGKISLEAIKKDKRSGERFLKRKDRLGNAILTNVKWIMEASWIGSFAKKHKDVTFIDAREGGLPIKGISYQSLEETAIKYLSPSLDVKGLLHAEIEMHRLHQIKPEMEKGLLELKKSLDKCLEITEEILKCKNLSEEDPLVTLLLLDLGVQVAYKVLLLETEKSLDKFLKRCVPSECIFKEKWERMHTILLEIKLLTKKF